MKYRKNKKRFAKMIRKGSRKSFKRNRKINRYRVSRGGIRL